MPDILKYRQQVSDFRSRLDTIIAGRIADKRVFIDTTGNHSRAIPFRNHEERLVQYGESRHHSVARVFALFEMLREHEHIDRRPQPVTVSGDAGAVWQAFKGNDTDNACHTCPALLRTDGHVPTSITKNPGFQRHIIVEFANCLLLPRSINKIDIVVDEAAGRNAFAQAGSIVLNERGVDWQQGLIAFKEEMRSAFNYVPEALLDGREFRSSDESNQAILDTLTAYYEGLYLHSVNPIEIDNFKSLVDKETGVP
jgi:hypothetical protein